MERMFHLDYNRISKSNITKNPYSETCLRSSSFVKQMIKLKNNLKSKKRLVFRDRIQGFQSKSDYTGIECMFHLNYNRISKRNITTKSHFETCLRSSSFVKQMIKLKNNLNSLDFNEKVIILR